MYYRTLNNGTRGKNGRVTALSPERKRALEERRLSWESVWAAKPGRDVTEAEAGRLAGLPPQALGPEIIRLVDEENVTQSSIADALGTRRSTFNSQVKAYRESGTWPVTSRRLRTVPPQGHATATR